MNTVTMESILMIKNTKVTMEEFKAKYSLPSEEMAIKMANVMISQGKISEYKYQTEEDYEIQKAIEEQMAIEMADKLDAEERYAQMNARAEVNKKSELVSFELDFNNSLEAQRFEAYCYSIGIEDTAIISKRGSITLLIENVSQMEFVALSKKYKNEKLTKTVVNGADKVITTTTDVVNKVATDVVAPVATIAGKGLLNIGKGLAQTLIKTGTGLINSSAKAVKETKVALDNDEDMIRAMREIKETKHSAKSWYREKMDHKNITGGSGIRIK